MKKVLIIGNDIHANRYRDVLSFRNDITISFNALETDLNIYDYIIFSEPYHFNVKWFNILKDFKKTLLLEKCQFKLNLIKKLKCNTYFIHLRDYDKNNKIKFLKDNTIVWPNLPNEKMSKIYHTLPNILDFISNKYKNFDKLKICECINEDFNLKLKMSNNEINFNIIIQDIEKFGLNPKINGNDIPWPNYFESINSLIDKIINNQVDFIKSFKRENDYKLLIRKVENIIMDLLRFEYSFNKNIIYKKSEQMLMAYNQDNGDMYEFNDVGAEIFLLMVEEKKMSVIFDELTDKYNVTIEEIYNDVEELINRLIDLNIIIKKEN